MHPSDPSPPVRGQARRHSRAASAPLGRRGTGAQVLVVVGARGGVGASTLAALLAARLARSAGCVALMDLDHGAGGLEVLLGIEEVPGVRWADLEGVRGALAPADLDGVLPRWCGVEVLGPDRRAGAPDVAVVSAVTAALVDRCTTVVVDLPAHTLLTDVGTATGRAAPVLAGRSDLLVLAGQDVLGVAGALALRAALDSGPAQLVLRRRRAARVAPLEAAHLLDLPLAGLLPTDRRLADATDRGFGPVIGRWSALGRAVRRLAEAVADG